MSRFLVRQTVSREKGAVALLYAVLAVVFAGFIAIAIDIIYASTSLQQARNNANMAALAALERYFSLEDENISLQERAEAAISRANEIAQLNVILGSAGRQTKVISAGGVNEDSPKLDYGKYFFTTPSSGNNPCEDGNSPPCFVPGGASTETNAIRIKGKLAQEVYLPWASVALGRQFFSVPIEAIATVVPRHGCFVVDLSASTVRETHDYDTTMGKTFEYAYFTNTLNPGQVGASGHQQKWDALLSNFPTRPAGPVDADIHYADDYVEKVVKWNADYDPAEDAEKHPAPTDENNLYKMDYQRKFMVDMFRGGEYSGPQPLMTIFRGMDRVIARMASRKVAGDKACLVFYDRDLAWSRVFKPTDKFEELRKITDLSVTNDPDRGIELAIKHGLLPFAQAETNTLKGMTEAVRQLTAAREEGVPSSDFVVLIGDGQTNCLSCSLKDPRFDYNHNNSVDSDDMNAFINCYYGGLLCSWSPYKNYGTCPYAANKCGWADANGNGVTQWDDQDWSRFYDAYQASGYCSGPPCNNTFTNYYFSMQELYKFASRELVNYQIPVHVVLVGENSGPHTVDVADPDHPGQCLDEATKRQKRSSWDPNYSSAQPYPSVQGLRQEYGWKPSCWAYPATATQPASTSCSPSSTDPAANDVSRRFLNQSADAPFYEPNEDLYAIAQMTGGVWAPIRPAPDGCVPEACRPDLARRTTDPECRSADAQIDDYMDEIMGQNPFTLVTESTPQDGQHDDPPISGE